MSPTDSKPELLPERRVETRRSVNRDFESLQQFIDEYVSDVSRSGVFIRSNEPLPVGTRVNLRCTVVLDALESIEGVGEVVRVVPPGGPQPSGMGVVFVELTQVSRQLIERILVRP